MSWRPATPGKAKHFYGQVFDWEFNDVQSMPYTEIKVSGQSKAGMIKMDEKWEGLPAHWTVYFAVDDTDATAKAAEESGGKVHVPPTDLPVGRFAVVSDPQGGTFTIIKLAN